jgi:hypothetical protein
MPAGFQRDPVGDAARFFDGVSRGDGQTGPLERGQIHPVVPHVEHFVPSDVGLAQPGFDGGDFRSGRVVEEIDLQILGPLDRGLAGASRDPAHADGRLGLQESQAQTVPNVEHLGLGSASHADRGVGQYAVHIADEETNSAGTNQ